MSFDNNQQILAGIASALVNPFRFIIRDTANLRVKQSGANGLTSGVGPDYEVALDEALPYAAGGVAQLELGGSVTAGDRLKSDATGKGVKLAAATADQNVGAVALKTGVSADVIPVQVIQSQEDVA